MNPKLTISNILAALAIVFVVITYVTPAPLLPIAVILVALSVIFAT